MKKIVITGGHFTPGLAVLDSLRSRGWEIHWVGESRALEGEAPRTLEYQILPRLDVPFWSLKTVKFNRKYPFATLFNLWRLPFGFLQSLSILSRIKPSVVLSFGSYVSLPVCLAGRFLGIPIVVHEQTAASGLANRIVAKFAQKVAISYPSSSLDFPVEKTVLTGNPVRSNIHKIRGSRRKKRIGRPPVLYITGGSRGSQIINHAVIEALPEILKITKVYHQTGTLDLEKMQKVRNRIHPSLAENYNVSAHFTPEEVEEIYTKSDLVISRAGANTVSELAAVGLPAILIPIPWVESDEQNKNAKILVQAGMAVILPQDGLSGGELLGTVRDMLKRLRKFRQNAIFIRKQSLVPKDAAQRLVSLVEEVANK